MSGDQTEAHARVLVEHSLAIQPGDVVVISGALDSEPLILAVFSAVLQRRGLPVVRLTADVLHEPRLRLSGSENDRWLNPLGVADGRSIDCSLGIWSHPLCAGPLETDAPEPDPKNYEAMTRPPDERARWVGTLYATDAGAALAGLSLDGFRALIAAAALLDCPDPAAAWTERERCQQALCDELETAHEMHFTTSSGTDLIVGVAGRRWYNGAGKFNLPDGEVLTAPWEDATRGVFVSDFPAQFRGWRIDGIRLAFRDGRVVDASAKTGERHLIDMLGRDAGAAVLGELALGMNDRITRATQHVLLDEKMAGTFHIALGAAYQQTGGRNNSSVHCDLIADLRNGGGIAVDGRTVNRNGAFLHDAPVLRSAARAGKL